MFTLHCITIMHHPQAQPRVRLRGWAWCPHHVQSASSGGEQMDVVAIKRLQISCCCFSAHSIKVYYLVGESTQARFPG